MSKQGGSSVPKPLKGISLQGNNGNFETLTVGQLNLSSQNIESLISGSQFDNVVILNSTIDNTIIGINGPNEGNFTNLKTTGYVTLYATNNSKYMSWDPSLGLLNINGKLTVSGCVTIGNIQICQNTINAINLNGDVNIISDGAGSINLTGPINNTVVSQGNYLTNLNNGNVIFNASSFISLTSNFSYLNLNSFNSQTLTTLNGDITLNTETGLSTKNITSIIQTVGKLSITSFNADYLNIGDIINITGSNSYPTIDGQYIVSGLNGNYSFFISTGNTFPGLISSGNTGTFIKTISNNINLNAAVYVKIPQNILLTFGTTDNSISGNTSGLYISSHNNIYLNISAGNILQIPQNVNFQFGTTSNNNVNYDGTSLNINSKFITLTGSTGNINTVDTSFYDPNPLIGNYTFNSNDGSDRGIQFTYYSGGSKTGWFGFKNSTNQFTYLVNTSISGEIVSGTLGDFNIGNVVLNSITISSGGNIDLGCGNLINAKLISGCSGIINILGSNTVNISSGSSISLIANSQVYIPNNIPISFSTNGSSIKQDTLGNLTLTGYKNINLSGGNIILPIGSKLSFDGTSIGNQNIVSDTNGNLIIDSNKNLYLTLTAGNVILPINTPIQFGNSTENIYGNTSGLYILSKSTNLISNSNVNISSSIGNINITSYNGDTFLLNTNGNVRLYNTSRLIFSISGTNNSIFSDTNANLIINGNGLNSQINLQNSSTINLSSYSGGNINIPTNVKLNIGNQYLISDTNGNFSIYNTITNGNINISSLNLNIINSGGNTFLSNINTNISSNSFIITGTSGYILNNNVTSGSVIYLDAQNVKITDPILTLANYNNSNDGKDRGIEFNYYNVNNSTNNLGWFGLKNSTQQFTFYSNAINNNEVISGTLGQFALGSVVISNNISFVSTGNIDMSCGTISNINTILGCNGTINIAATSNINISSSNIYLQSKNLQLPFSSTLAFGNTSNSLIMNSNGNMTINVSGGNGTLIINSNVQINGTTDNVYSTITNYQDPILSIGGVSNPVTNDLKDRGIEFKWNNGTIANTGFFGFQNSSQRFIFMAFDTNNNEIISGTLGNVQFGNAYFNNLDVNCGTISNVSSIIGCVSTGLNITSTSGINISSSSIILNSPLDFGNSTNSIYLSGGNLNIQNSGNVNLITNTFGASVNISKNTNLNFGSTSNSISSDTFGNLIIANSVGNIYLTPQISSGNIIIPANNFLVFGSSGSQINGDGTTLSLYGYDIAINSSNVTITGNVNIIGSLTAISTSITSDVYIFPLGTEQNQTIISATNTSPTSSNIIITTLTNNYLNIGDYVNLKNTNTNPIIDGSYYVTGVVSPQSFRIAHTPLISSGANGLMTSVLTTDPGKDIGLQFNYWNTTGNASVTAGSSNYHTAFLGYLHNNQTLTYYSNAIITNANLVASGTLGNFQVDELIANQISGFTLLGPIVGGNNLIAGTNFQINGGLIDNTLIGATTAQSGRFTTLSSTVSTTLNNVTFQSDLNYSLERFSLSSLFPTRNPSVNTIMSFISITGVSFIGSGTMGSSGLNDGQLKIIVISSMGTNCQYQLKFPSGKLTTPNSTNPSGIPSLLTFKRQGQSVQIVWDNVLNSWILLTSGVYIS